MKKDKVRFKSGEFTDFLGETRQFTFAAISYETEEVVGYEVDNKEETISQLVDDFKRLDLGVSVCNVGDEYNEELGRTVAEGKARKTPFACIVSDNKGVINEAVVEAMLTQEVEYMKQNPGKYIAGYNKQKAEYEETLVTQQEYDALGEEGKNIVTTLSELHPDELDQILDLVEAKIEGVI